MSLERSFQQLDDSIIKKGFLRSRIQNLRDDVSVISSVSNFGSQQTSILMKEKTDQLYSHFLSVIQTSSNELEVFDTIFQLRQVLVNTIEGMENEGAKKKLLSANNWIRQEMNTWGLIHCLYKDRLITQKEEMDVDDLPLVNSEKLVIEHLYSSKFNFAGS